MLLLRLHASSLTSTPVVDGPDTISAIAWLRLPLEFILGMLPALDYVASAGLAWCDPQVMNHHLLGLDGQLY